MKKIKILSFASLPLAMALLAGCGHTHTFSEEWNHDANKHWHDATCEHKDQVSEEGDHVYGDDNICDVCGYDKGGEPGPGPGPGPGPQPEIDHTVTAEEWLAFWENNKPFYIADNYKATMVMTADGQSGSQTSVMTVDGNKAKFEGLIDGVAVQLDYSEFISEDTYRHYEYDKIAEKWFYEEGSNNPVDDFAMMFQPFFTMTGFNYDEASKSYKKETSGVYSNLVIQFGAKKVTSYSFNALMPDGHGGTMATKIEGTFDYNGQSVTLPDPAYPAHHHSFNILKHDATSHWYECECGEKDSYSINPHYDGDWDCKCDVCEYAMPVDVTPGYWMLTKDGTSCSLEENGENPGEFMTEWYFGEDDEFSLFNVTDSAYNRYSELTLSNDEVTSGTGVTISEGVVTIHETANYRFYLDPTYNEGRGILYVAKDEGPLPSESVYGYSYNNGEYESMIDCGKGAQWQLVDFHMNANETLKFADIVNPDMPNQITYLEDNGNLQGFTNVEGVLTAGADGYYVFTLNFDGEGNASITIGIGEEPTPETNVYLKGSFDEWGSGYPMYLNSGSETEYVITGFYVKAGDTIKVKEGADDSGYCEIWKTGGEKNAIDLGYMTTDGQNNAKAIIDLQINVYYETSNVDGKVFGAFVEFIQAVSPYSASGTYMGQTEYLNMHFDKIENGYAQYIVTIPEGYINSHLVYAINNVDGVMDVNVEQVDEGVNFEKQSDNTFKYKGSADTLNLYLKVYLDGSGYGLYVANAAEPVDDRIPKTLTLKADQSWAFNDPNVLIFAWVWGNGNEGSWISVDYEVGSTSTTVLIPPTTEGLLLVRCPLGTTTPSWDITSGDEPGRIYNKTKNVNIGTQDSYEVEFVDYPEA